MEQLPFYIPVTFILTALLTLFFLYKASKQSIALIGVAIGWLLLQGLLALRGFYTQQLPSPRFLLLPGIPLLFLVVSQLLPKGRQFTGGFSLQWLTWLHTVRILVELVLFWLYQHKQVPRLMTFEGRNFDVLSGLSAPVVAYFAFRTPVVNRKLLLVWNILCLGLLLNIVINASLSAPVPMQQFAFDQPNVAVLYFPFIWLPCFIVPTVLLAHVVAIRKLYLHL